MNQTFINRRYVFLIIPYIFILFMIIISTSLKTDFVDFTTSNSPDSTSIVGELTNNNMVIEKIISPYKNLKSISIQFANFSNRKNSGTVEMSLYKDNKLIDSILYNASSIKDGEYLTLPVHSNIDIGDELILKISSKDGQSGSSVTCFISNNSLLDKLGNKLFVNNVSSNKHLNLKYSYNSNQLNFDIFLIIVLILVFVYIITKNKYTNMACNLQKLYPYFILFTIAFILLSLRDLSFLTSPNLYAEDAIYIGNILNKGLLSSMFSTRSGGGNDFQNTGSYILLWIALKINTFIHGYNLTYLPTYIGIIANSFFSLIALIGYITFRQYNKFLSICIFLCIVLIPTGMSGSEIFGRVLNTVFIWPVLLSFLLLILLNNSISILKSNFIGIICIIAGLSFPISYGIVGIYLFFSFLTQRNTFPISIWLKRNICIIFSLIIGIYLFPIIITSQGAATPLKTNPDSIIEFIFARHFLYSFIHIFYHKINNIITIFLFIIYVAVILLSLYCIRKYKNELYFFLLLIFFTFGCTFSSAIMRIKMTQLFQDYTSTFPDRYYYGCNILNTILLIYSIFLIIKYSNLNIKYFYTSSLILLFFVINNNFLFEGISPSFNIFGENYYGDFKDCIKSATTTTISFSNQSYIPVGTYPDIMVWKINLPLPYVITTILN